MTTSQSSPLSNIINYLGLILAIRGTLFNRRRKLAPSPRLLFRWFNRTTRRHQLSVSLSKVHNQVHPMLVLDNKSSNNFPKQQSSSRPPKAPSSAPTLRGKELVDVQHQIDNSRCSCTIHNAIWVEVGAIAAGGTTVIPQTISSAQNAHHALRVLFLAPGRLNIWATWARNSQTLPALSIQPPADRAPHPRSNTSSPLHGVSEATRTTATNQLTEPQTLSTQSSESLKHVNHSKALCCLQPT